MKKEKWLSVKGYDGYYEVSNAGRLKSVDRTVPHKNGRTRFLISQIINAKINRYGYRLVNLQRYCKIKRMSIHRLVAGAFIANPENKPQINHKNGVKSDNRVDNLEWCSASENRLHAYRTGLQDAKGERNGRSILTVKMVKKIRELKKEGIKQCVIAEMYCISNTIVSQVINGQRWGHIL